MPKDVNEIVVGANGSIRVAPVGTVAPADESAAPDAAWVDLGFATEDGVTFTDAKTLAEIPVWQLFYPARRIVTARDLTIAFTLRQWSKDTVTLGFGGGTFSTPTAGHHKYVPPAPDEIDERALMVDWADGAKAYRLVLTRGLVRENVSTKLSRANAADLPISFGLLGTDTGDPWVLLSNDPAFA